MALTFREWRRENSGTMADYNAYLRGLAETAREANQQPPSTGPVAAADAEIGTTRSVNAAGRELIRAAVAARGGLVTYVAWDGVRIAKVVPLAPADPARGGNPVLAALAAVDTASAAADRVHDEGGDEEAVDCHYLDALERLAEVIRTSVPGD